ncbi:MAG: hypothetical protein JWQ25_1202 [Daejeonella sp.]|nr:hypothetical protein [Daejeonella sp.]
MKKVLFMAFITAAVSVGVLSAKGEHNASYNENSFSQQDTTKKDTTSKKPKDTTKKDTIKK